MIRKTFPALWLLAPLPAIAVGALVARAHGIAPTAFAPNLAAAILGVVLVLCLPARAHRWLPWVAALGIAATLVAPGLDGVHRWLPLEPIRLHMSAALAPFLLLALPSRWGMALVFGVQVVHLFQPDAAQATALALVAVLVVGASGLGVLFSLGMLTLAALTWLRPDPLQPVAHVEEIFRLAIDGGLGWLIAALAALFLALWPLDAWGRVYLAGALGGAFIGFFPVPLLGAGAGPVLGWYGLLAVRRWSPKPTE